MGILSSPEKSAALRENLRLAVERGKHTGKLPLGYSYPDRYGNLPTVNEGEARTVREAFRLAAAGKTLSEITLLLGRTAHFGRDGKRLGRSSVYAMLTNPYYSGSVRLNGTVFDGKHRAIVTTAEFDEAQRSLSSRLAMKVSERLGTLRAHATDNERALNAEQIRASRSSCQGPFPAQSAVTLAPGSDGTTRWAHEQ